MGTKTYNNYQDLITFSRASAGYALRPVSYGSELVTNGDGSSVTNWSSPRSNSTLSVNSGRLRSTASASGAYGIAQTLSNLTVGAIYFYSANVYADGGSGNMIFRISALSSLDNQPVSDEQSTTRLVSGSFVATASTMYVGGIHVASSAGDYIELDNISIKKVTLDESDGTLTLFEHPNNVPRVEYDADGNRLGLLVEESRTNLVTYSDFDAGVSTSAATITADTVTSPDGTQNAATLELTGSTSGFAYYTVTVTASTDYTWSWFAKAGTATAHVYAVYDNSNAAFVNRQEYTLTSGENYGNGWYRHQVAFTTPAGCTSVRIYPQRNTDAGGAVAGTQGTMFVWGGQLEAGTFASSIIRTTGSTASRSADVASIPTADFGYNTAKGTVVCKFSFNYENGGSGFPRPWEIGNTNNVSERINIYLAESTGALVSSVITNNATQGNLTLKTGLSGSVDTTVAFAWARDSLGASDDGDTAVTDTAADILPTGTQRNVLSLKQTNATNANINGHIKYIKYYPRRLTNAQLEDLSS